MPIEVLVEDCLLLVRSGAGGGREGGRERRKWRSFAVEGRREEVQLFLSGTKLGRWMYEGGMNEQAVLKGYPGFLLLLKEEEGRKGGGEGGHGGGGKEKDKEKKHKKDKRHKKEKEADDDEDEEEDEDEDEVDTPAAPAEAPHVCPISVAAVAELTSSTLYPIPPLPPNPYRGLKKACKLKQISLVCVRHPETGKFLAVEEAKSEYKRGGKEGGREGEDTSDLSSPVPPSLPPFPQIKAGGSPPGTWTQGRPLAKQHTEKRWKKRE